MSGAIGIADIKQKNINQVMDMLARQEGYDVAREGHQVTRRGQDLTNEAKLEKIESLEKLAEYERTLDKEIAAGRKSVAEGKLDLAKFISEKGKEYAPQQAIDKEGNLIWVQPGSPIPPGSRPVREGLTTNQQLSQQSKDDEDALAIESGIYKGYKLPKEAQAARVVIWNRNHPEDPYIEEEISGSATTIFGKQVPGFGPEKRWVRRSEALGTPTPPTPPTPPKTFDTLPPAIQYKDRMITDTSTGKRFKSDGTKWVEVK